MTSKPFENNLSYKGMTQSIEVQTGSGNIFEGFGPRKPGRVLVKAELARRISGIITTKIRLQAEATEIFRN